MVLALFLVIFDSLGGAFMREIYLRSTVNPIFKALRGKPHTLILGSSTTMTGLDPALLGDGVHNASENGQSIFYAAAFLRHLPAESGLETVIFGLDVQDAVRGHKSEFMKYLKTLAPLAGYDDVLLSKYELSDPFVRMKYFSNLYPYQGRGRRIVFEWRRPVRSGNGYTPHDGSERRNPLRKPDDKLTPLPAPEESLEGLSQIVEAARARNLQLLVVALPWRDEPFPARQPRYAAFVEQARAIMAGDGICDLTWETDPLIAELAQDETLFLDRQHLNGKGAEIYSRFIAQRIANRCGAPSRLSSP